MKKQPEITERTRQKFVDTFWSLAKEKPISKIAVNELTRRAGYNRSTFYEYFLDTDDLLAYAETKLLEDIERMILQIPPERKSFSTVFQAVFAAMNEEIYLLLGPNGDSGFLARMKSKLYPLIETFLPISADAPHFDYLTTFANSALFGLLQHWNEKGKDLSTEEIGALMQDLLLHGLLNHVVSVPAATAESRKAE